MHQNYSFVSTHTLRRFGFAALIAALSMILATTMACTTEETDSSKTTSDEGVTLAITEPENGTTVGKEEVVIKGTSTGAAEIQRSKSGVDDKFKPSEDGNWEFKLKLSKGENKLDFYVKDHPKVRAAITIKYDQNAGKAQPALSVTEPENGTTVGKEEVVIKGTSSAASQIRRVKSGSDDKIKPGSDGNWEFKLKLSKGENKLEFYIDGNDKVRANVTINYDPNLAKANADPTAASASQPEPTDRIVRESPAAATPTPSAPAYITGLTAQKVTDYLKSYKFTCTQKAGATQQLWSCRGPQEWQVDMMGPSGNQIRSVNATVFGTDATASALLGYLASLPYGDANPSEATKWVQSNIAASHVGRGAETTFGSARFTLSGPSNAVSLDIVAIGAK